MLKTYFNNIQLLFIIISCFFFIISIFFHVKEKERYSIFFLVAAALSVYLFAALLDPFLNVWDERFHALVAKNLMTHPLKPTLFDDPIVDIDYNNWDRYHIWLHKQPLFLWQIALSFKLFGISEFTLRLPNAILCSTLIIAGYRSGKLIADKNTGYFCGLLFATSFYIIELISGRQELDQNDASFFAYISLSLWAWLEYIYSSKKVWIVLAGLFSGFAVLCKWLPGLLIYLAWFVYNFQMWRFQISKYKEMLIAFAITVIIALPWQLYTFCVYPEEASLAYEFNANHFLKILDGHSGSFWYHFDMIQPMYGSWVQLLFIPALIIFYLKSKDRKMFFALLSCIIFVYIFFTLAETKMPSFTLIIALPVFLTLAYLLNYISILLNKIIKIKLIYQSIVFISLILSVFFRVDIEKIQEIHTGWKPNNHYTKIQSQNAEIFRTLNLPYNAVIFNAGGRQFINAMFYTGLPAYNIIPTFNQFNYMIKKGRLIAIFKPKDCDLDSFLIKSKSVIIINQEIQVYE